MCSRFEKIEILYERLGDNTIQTLSLYYIVEDNKINNPLRYRHYFIVLGPPYNNTKVRNINLYIIENIYTYIGNITYTIYFVIITKAK